MTTAGVSRDGIQLIDVVPGQLHKPDVAGLVHEAFTTVLRPSFSVEELPDDQGILASLQPGGGGVLTIATDPDGPVGAALCEFDGRTGIDLLGYLAVRPGRRSAGVGSQLLDHLSTQWREAGDRWAIAEIHDPRRWPETNDERPAARLSFYARWGAQALDIPWVQPSLGPGLSRVRDMLLIVLNGPAMPDRTGIHSNVLIRWAHDYFVATEGRTPDDEQYRALHQRLAGRAEIPVRPLKRYKTIPLLDHMK